MKLFLKILSVLILVGYLIASYILLGDKDRDVQCKRFYINIVDSLEYNMLQRYDLYHYLDEAGMIPIGKTAQMIDTDEIERYVSRIGLVDDVQCYRMLNGDVYLDVSQRRPIMRVITDENKTYYLDKAGQHIAVDTMYVDYLPLVMGCVDDTISAVDLIPMIDYISSHTFWNAQVDYVYITPRHEIEIVPRVGNHVILMGTKDNYINKMDRVLALYEQVMPRIGWSVYDTISVRYNDQIVCTRRDKKYRHQKWTNQ